MALRATTFLTLADLKTWCKVTPSQARSVSSLVAAGTLATAISSNHGFRHQDTVLMAGATPAAFNGTFAIDLVDANTFTYPLTQVPATTPATGTITAQSNQDRVLTILGDRVSSFLESQLDRIFAKREDVGERQSGNGATTIRLKYYPVIKVNSLTIDGVELEEDTHFIVEHERGVLRMKTGVVTKGIGNVEIDYDAGYEPDELPADVIGLALDIAKYFYDRHMSQGLAVSSLSIGGSNVSIVADLPQDLRKALTKLSNPRMVG